MRKKNEWCWKRNRQKIEIESNTRLDDRENGDVRWQSVRLNRVLVLE